MLVAHQLLTAYREEANRPMASIPGSDIQLAIEKLKERMIKERISVEEAFALEKADHPQLKEIVYEMAVDAIKAELSI